MPAERFYNDFVSEHFNVEADYRLWKSGGAPFTFCEHPYVLSSAAKSKLLMVESHLHMQRTVQQSRVEHIFGGGGGAAAGPTVGLVRKREDPAARPQPPQPRGPRWLQRLFGQQGAGASFEPPQPPISLDSLPTPHESSVPASHPDFWQASFSRTHYTQHARPHTANT